MGQELGQWSAPFRELFDLTPDAILVYLGGSVVQANPAAVELLRAPSLQALVGRPSRELLAPESLPGVAARAQALMAGLATSTRAEETYVRLDGTRVEVEAHASRASFYEGKAFIVLLRDITLRKTNEERIRREREAAARTAAAEEREQWLREIIDLLPLLVFARDDRGAFVLCNRQCSEFFNRPAHELLGKTAADMGYDDAAFGLSQEDDEVLRSGVARRIQEREVRDARGRRRIYEGVKSPLRRGDQRPAVLYVWTELTERRKLEEQLLHSQKMDGLGRLAGGVAHDFNNLLTVILESTEHLAASAPDPEGDLVCIREAATRAASLTGQLLTFARRAPAMPRVVSVDALVEQSARMLVRVVGEDVALVTDLHAGGACARLDPAQLEVVIMNAAINARDAMPEGGTLVLATRTTTAALAAGAPEAECVVIEIRDTGAGMDEATRERAFDPFFTTKPLGSGLGLSTSYGIATQLGGRIELESAPARGTCLRLFVPRCESPVASDAVPGVRVGGETVLLLEDDTAVRRATSRMLRSLGYVVLDAALPSQALALAREHAGPIDVLLSDVVMPEMNGFEAARAFRSVRPEAAIVFVSGYSHDARAQTEGEPEVQPLPKPFTRSALASALREAIERHAMAASGS